MLMEKFRILCLNGKIWLIRALRFVVAFFSVRNAWLAYICLLLLCYYGFCSEHSYAHFNIPFYEFIFRATYSLLFAVFCLAGMFLLIFKFMKQRMYQRALIPAVHAFLIILYADKIVIFGFMLTWLLREN